MVPTRWIHLKCLWSKIYSLGLVVNPARWLHFIKSPQPTDTRIANLLLVAPINDLIFCGRVNPDQVWHNFHHYWEINHSQLTLGLLPAQVTLSFILSDRRLSAICSRNQTPIGVEKELLWVYNVHPKGSDSPTLAHVWSAAVAHWCRQTEKLCLVKLNLGTAATPRWRLMWTCINSSRIILNLLNVNVM